VKTRTTLLSSLLLTTSLGIASLGGCSDTAPSVDGSPLEEPGLPPRGSTSADASTRAPADTNLFPKADAGAPDDAKPNVGLPPAPACELDTRTIYFEGARKIESITAYGRYWSREVFIDGSWKDGVGFPAPLVNESKFMNGPCAGNPSCSLETRVVYFDSGKKIESTTAYGKLFAWTFQPNGTPSALAGYPQLLSSSAPLASGPCAGSGSGCAIDTRAVWVEGNQKIESITAGNKLWSFTLGDGGQRTALSSNGAPLASVPRFAAGPCFGYESACVFDTRTVYVDGEGTKREEITARGRLWAYILGADDSMLGLLTNGTPLVDIPRLKPMCP
jgi:hypothetical protein